MKVDYTMSKSKTPTPRVTPKATPVVVAKQPVKVQTSAPKITASQTPQVNLPAVGRMRCEVTRNTKA